MRHLPSMRSGSLSTWARSTPRRTAFCASSSSSTASNGLAVELEDEAQNAVRRGVLRAHVDNDPLLMEGRCLIDDGVPVATDRVIDVGALGVLGVGCRSYVDVAILFSHHMHDPISCTTCAGPAAGWWRPCTPPGCHQGDSPCVVDDLASRPA